jgi:flagellar biosynthesis anti-sigma factor FlgM
MRIDIRNSGAGSAAEQAGASGQTSASAGVAKTGASGNAASATAVNADSVSFSFNQARVASLTKQALAAPEVRQQKVAGFQQAIAAGTYSVDAGKVAGALAAEVAS